MKAGVVVFPGSNCDRDVQVALEAVGFNTQMIWHKDTSLPSGLDLIVLPGGFSYGDYLRCGAISAHSNIMQEVKTYANKGGKLLGICNGFQILSEAGLVPGALLRNKNLKFICREVYLKAENTDTSFSTKYKEKQTFKVSIAHHDGNFFTSADELKAINDNGQVAFRYCDANGNVSDAVNPNGSLENIAGVFNKNKNVLGLMPHPERHFQAELGSSDGRLMFESLLG